MMINQTLKQLRNTFLAVGAAVLLPLSAQAMVTDHDTVAVDAEPSAETAKNLSGERHRATALRFGAYSAVGVDNTADTIVEGKSGNAGGTGARQSNELFNRLP